MLDTGSRILAVADIFSAITERRPYRDSMPKEKAMSVLKENANKGDICKDIVAMLFDNYDHVVFMLNVSLFVQHKYLGVPL